MALEELALAIDVPLVEGEEPSDRARLNLDRVAGILGGDRDVDVADAPALAGDERELDVGAIAGGVHRVVEQRLQRARVAVVPETRHHRVDEPRDAHAVEHRAVERPQHALHALAVRQRVEPGDGERIDDDRRPLVDAEEDAHLLVARGTRHAAHLRLVVAALPVVEGETEDVALELERVEAAPAPDDLEDPAQPARRRGRDRVGEIGIAKAIVPRELDAAHLEVPRIADEILRRGGRRHERGADEQEPAPEEPTHDAHAPRGNEGAPLVRRGDRVADGALGSSGVRSSIRRAT